MAGNPSVDDPKDWVTVPSGSSPNDPGDWQTAGSAKPTALQNVGSFLNGAVGDTFIRPAIQAASHPFDTAGAILKAGENRDGLKAAHDAILDPNLSPLEKMQATEFGLPVIGPALKSMHDTYASGDHARAYGQATGMLASILAGDEAPKVGAGKATAAMVDRAGNALTPKMPGLVNSYIGLQPSDLPRFARATPGRATDIGATVYKEAGLKPTLEAQRDAIKSAMDNHTAQTEAIINNAGGNIDMGHLLTKHAFELSEDMERSGVTDDKFSALDKNLDGLMADHSGVKTPAEALELRRALGSRIKDWDPATTNVESAYLQRVYHGLNDSIHDSLAPNAQAAFRNNNRTVSNLRTAYDAAGEKLVKGEMEPGGVNLRSAISAYRKGAAAGTAHMADNLIPISTQARVSMFPGQAAHAVASGIRAIDPFTGIPIAASPFIPQDK